MAVNLLNNFVSAKDRINEERSTTAVIFGKQKVGKTYLLKTLTEKQLSETLFVNLENGDVSLGDLKVDTMNNLKTWEEISGLFVWLFGADLRRTDGLFSEERYNALVEEMGGTAKEKLPHIKTIFVDSLTEASKISLADSVRRNKGNKNEFAKYGDHGDDGDSLINIMQHANGYNVVLLGHLEYGEDEYKRQVLKPMLDGKKWINSIKTVFDSVILMEKMVMKDEDGNNIEKRRFRCKQSPETDLPGNRIGLSEFEPADLSKLLEKIQVNNKKEEVAKDKGVNNG